MIDFRSDTVTRPVPAMRLAMSRAEVGDDVFGDDPSVNALEQRMAELSGMPAAMLAASGTQSNLIALLSHCGRGDEYIVGQAYHTYLYEAGGATALGGIVPQPISVEADGTLALSAVQAVIKPDDVHFARSKLLSLENTHAGKAIPPGYFRQAHELAQQAKLAMHLDGARVFNAVVALGLPLSQFSTYFDSVSICCSKGLGAPIGSVLCGSQEFIREARRWRKMVGGGMRQAGILAAAIDYALTHHIQRLAEDHYHAELLQAGLSQIAELQVETAHTNMLYFSFEDARVAQQAQAFLRQKGILIASGQRVRLVTHLDIQGPDIADLLSQLKQFFLNLN